MRHGKTDTITASLQLTAAPSVSRDLHQTPSRQRVYANCGYCGSLGIALPSSPSWGVAIAGTSRTLHLPRREAAKVEMEQVHVGRGAFRPEL